MHGGGEFRTDADDNVAEDDRSVRGVDLNGDDLLVLNAELLCVFGGEVDVTLRGDHALFDIDLAGGADDLDAGGAGDVARLSDGSGDSERTGVGQGDLYLSRGTDGTEDADVCDRLLRSDEGDSLLGRELSGLREHFLYGKRRAFSEESFDVLFREVNVTRGGFNEYFCHFYLSFRFLYFPDI